ncbi:hypothetical protein VS868_02800 [Salinimicrobium sp. 3283s]|uniref:hypothetical protein n=1 Tax=Salinimicrobium sp. 3283s TaxID=3114359 RepID=UPI0031E868FA
MANKLENAREYKEDIRGFVAKQIESSPARIANPRQHCENKLENAGEHKGNICEFVAKLQVESSRHGL